MFYKSGIVLEANETEQLILLLGKHEISEKV